MGAMSLPRILDSRRPLFPHTRLFPRVRLLHHTRHNTDSSTATPVSGQNVVAIVPAAISSAAGTGSPAMLAKAEGRLSSTILAKGEPGPTTLAGEGRRDPAMLVREGRPGPAILAKKEERNKSQNLPRTGDIPLRSPSNREQPPIRQGGVVLLDRKRPTTASMPPTNRSKKTEYLDT